MSLVGTALSPINRGIEFAAGLSNEDLLGTAPSLETFSPFSEEQGGQRQQLIQQLLGGGQPGGATQFNTGASQQFDAAQLRDPNAQFQSFSNVADQLQVIQQQGLRSLNEGLAQSRGTFGGSAFGSDARNALERQQGRGIQQIGERQTNVLGQFLERANQRNFQQQENAFGQNLQARLQAQGLGAQSFENLQSRLLQGSFGQSAEKQASLAQLTQLLNNPDIAAAVLGGQAGLLPGLISAGGSIAGGIAAGSDRKLKTDITHFDKGTLAKLRQLDGAKWKWKKSEEFRREEDGRKSGGVIAQELQKVLPELVHTQSTFHLGPGKEQKHLTVDYHGLTGALVTAVRELADKIDDMEKS